jgi:Putative zinc-finger
MTGGGQCVQVRLELGVYLLGAIEPARRSVVDRHLAACRTCRTELSDLAGLPSLLRRVPADAVGKLVAEDPAPVNHGPSLGSVLGRMTALRRRRRVLAVAAVLISAIAAASGVRALHAASPRPQAAAAPTRAITVQAANPVTNARATVKYTAQRWGTELDVRVTGIAPGTRCQLLVTGSGGQTVTAGGWYVTAGQKVTWYPASVPLQEPSVRGFEITADGRTLVSIPARDTLGVGVAAER